MSGGAFDYKQYNITMIADEVEQIILNSGKPKTQEELRDSWGRDNSWYELSLPQVSRSSSCVLGLPLLSIICSTYSEIIAML